MIVSDPLVAKHLLKDNAKAYSKVCIFFMKSEADVCKLGFRGKYQVYFGSLVGSLDLCVLCLKCTLCSSFV